MTSKPRNQSLMFVLAVFLMMVCGGCAYFRWGEPSYSELKQRQQEQNEINSNMFKPGTTFYTQ